MLFYSHLKRSDKKMILDVKSQIYWQHCQCIGKIANDFGWCESSLASNDWMLDIINDGVFGKITL